MNVKSNVAPEKNRKPKIVKPAISEKAFYLIALALLSKQRFERDNKIFQTNQPFL